ncbi:MAG: NAD(P)H-dependent oxidoreductase subunit E [Candidatus Zixiibacteriota bacterium]|nr:MAG: NAD(P)H-dependent oxidoreductase subunit E [candidate division Zixibacteria bacterium]
MRLSSTGQLTQLRTKCQAAAKKHKKKVLVCCGPGCLAAGAQKIADRFRTVLKQKRIAGFSVQALKETGCHGFCEQGPLVVIEPGGTFYTKVKTRDVEEIIDRSVRKDEVVQRLLYKDPRSGKSIRDWAKIDFYAHQNRIALQKLGQIAQCDIEDYIAGGGYAALAKALTKMTGDRIIDEVTTSGLRGRGGAGFAAGRKWRTCKDVQSDTRYVICNGDEGDPGAFMDRAIMEGDPHSVLEGMIIAAFAVGSSEGYIYVREEYPLAVVNLQKAIEQAEALGLLGNDILGTGFSFSIKISRGAGAFVCGESSALMKSVAGQVGEPRAKYIRSVIKGLHDRPTVLNNVETFANVPVIIDRGADWFAKIGAKNNSGTKAFSLVGKVRNTGLIEVAMGTTLRKIIFDIGGGIIGDRPFKAVQTGGPSGGCLPQSQLDLPVDFDSLTKAGSMMGSGGMIVMDDKTCMVDVAKYFLGFLVEESCGKCVPCREGLYQLHRLTIKVSEGRATEEDLSTIEKLSEMVIIGSLCGLGKSGPNPVLSTMKYFKDEYLAHIRDKRCPAGVCRELITYEITPDCTGCMACIAVCATHAITGKKGKVHTLDQAKCTKCGACYAVCQHDAVLVS